MSTVFKRPVARRDLVEHYVHLIENAGLDTAERFLACAEESFTDLVGQPRIGALVNSSRAALAGMRKWHVKDFDNFLIFYLSHSRGISIIRVLHAARDWWKLLGIV
jgi:toxin ParE1/3/4